MYLSASGQREVRDKIQPVVTLQFDQFQLKKKEFFTTPKKFGIAFVGRMEKVQAQLEDLNDLMVKHWVTKGDKVRLLACTPSKVSKVFDKGVVDIGSYPRQEFWRLMQEETHVVVSLGREMGFSLSLLEPIMLGTPAVVLKRPYVLPLLGPDYPFYVSGPAEANGMVEWMFQNYPTAYQKFMEYHQNWLVPEYKRRFQADLLYPKVVQAMDDLEKDLYYQMNCIPEKTQNEIVQLIAERVKDRDEFVLEDVIKELGESGDLGHLAKKAEEDWSEGKGLPWLPTWNEHRLIFKYLFGWYDASTVVGHLRRTAP